MEKDVFFVEKDRKLGYYEIAMHRIVGTYPNGSPLSERTSGSGRRGAILTKCQKFQQPR